MAGHGCVLPIHVDTSSLHVRTGTTRHRLSEARRLGAESRTALCRGDGRGRGEAEVSERRGRREVSYPAIHIRNTTEATATAVYRDC